MRFSLFGTAISLAAVAVALPSPANYVVHEKRSGTTSWSPKDNVKLDGTIKLPVRIGLTESNLNLGDGILMDVSDPVSESYGKHLSAQQVKHCSIV